MSLAPVPQLSLENPSSFIDVLRYSFILSKSKENQWILVRSIQSL